MRRQAQLLSQKVCSLLERTQTASSKPDHFQHICATPLSIYQLRGLTTSCDSDGISKGVTAQYTVLKAAGGGGPVLRTPVYAIVELGATQFKVSPGDLIYAERLKGVEVGAELALGRVQVASSKRETLVGRPYIEGASVLATVEEQVQDTKVISFKKRRRKNSRRTKGHRQMLTGLRITGVNGITTSADAPQQIAAF